jgi:hypothetical protein
MSAKQRVAAAIVAGGLILGGATAWAQTGGGNPSRPATEQAVTTTAAPSSGTTTPSPDKAARKQQRQQQRQERKAARKAGRLAGLGRAVHGTLTVRNASGGYDEITFDRGTVKAASATSITIANDGRPDVTIAVNGDTKVHGAASAADVQTGAPATVISKAGVATQILQRPGK